MALSKTHLIERIVDVIDLDEKMVRRYVKRDCNENNGKNEVR